MGMKNATATTRRNLNAALDIAIEMQNELKRLLADRSTRNWGHAGDSAVILEGLRETSDQLFGRGEYADCQQ